MSYTYTNRSALSHKASSPSPLRQASTASSNSSSYSTYSSHSAASSNGFPPPATRSPAGHRRGLSEAGGALKPQKSVHFDLDPVETYSSTRQSLRPLPQSPSSTPPRSPEKPRSPAHGRSQSIDPARLAAFDGSGSPPPKSRPNSMAIARTDSVRMPMHDRPSRASVHFPTGHIEAPDLQSLQRSSTGHLRTLSKFAADASEEDFSITSPEQVVVGLQGRRRLQRNASTRKKSDASSGWGRQNWMDQQRQFLQAYEYLCHIGEAKEWIEDIINKPIPPIVQLEEALRDGVTFAEIVQALHPEKQYRIFRHAKLQFRHSDNIALFFRYLAEVELPELFRFELVDLYDKKNIPKVIYCIHALSWLLFRKGIVDFRIGNLVGQLQFEDHELEAMQKGLDKAGISMPNFSGMGANFGAEPEPEPEPVETEEERIDRELAEHEHAIVDLQAQIRGAMLRVHLGDTMQQLWDVEDWIVDLQSRVRGDMARQVSQYRLDMKRFAVDLQSAARGFLVRSKRQGDEQYWKEKEKQVVVLQSLARARKARSEVQYIKSRAQKHENGIRKFQAAIRGALKRREVADQYDETREAEVTVQNLQAAIRGALVRKKVDDQYADTRAEESTVEFLQAAVRGMLQRQSQRTDQESLRQQETLVTLLQASARGAMARKQNADLSEKLVSTDVNWSDFQAIVRGSAVRHSLADLRQQLLSLSSEIIDLQAASRGAQLRQEVTATLEALQEQEDVILQLQSNMRGYMLRQRHFSDLDALQAELPQIVDLQSACRGFLNRQRTFDLLCELNEHEEPIVDLQSIARAMMQRVHVGGVLSEIEQQEDAVVELQALARAEIVRRKFVEKKQHYKENMEKVIKIQSFIRGRQQGEAYKSLTSGKNPPVGTIKNFVHLLNDSDFDFDEEIEFERLRKSVVQHVRQNEMAEQYVDQLDIKIALLVKNKITLDEVVKHQKHFGGHVGNLLANRDISSKDPFDLKALNKNSRRKLEHYQELFFMLQTQPQYLARLFKKLREQATPEKECKRIEQLMLVLFGFAQKRREEYYLLKLFARSLKEELDASPSLQDYTRGTFFWNKILLSYVRSPRDRKFLRDLLGSLIKENIIENETLDLESDPMQIYRSSINNEELRTGQRSRRRPDIAREEAIRDPETRETFIAHLEDLRDIADQFFAALEDVLHRLPYGIRYIAQQTFELLRARFQHEDQQHLLQVVGHWTWKTYIQPALLQPELWGVIDRGLSPLQKRNLGEVAKVIGQVAAGRLFGGENVYLQPLNSYVTQAIIRLEDIWVNLINVRDVETQFDIDEFNDLYARQKPTLYIKLSDIFAIHNLIVTDMPLICPTQDDPLREVIRELGSAKNNESELIGVSSNEISLTLNPKLHDVEDPNAAVKALFMETKRLVLYIIRIQTGSNLLDIMVRPITDEDEQKWDALIHEELSMETRSNHRHSRNRSSYYSPSDLVSNASSNPASPLHDITNMSYTELKRTCLENILSLERAGRISRHNQYQDLLNAIAIDIRTKHRRRIQRARELEGVRATLANLDEKSSWLEGQLKSYNDYVEQAMITLQNKKGKKRFLLPFTKQYNHERELQRSGRVPKFGSFKYSARTLAEKGVLISWAPYDQRQWDKLDLTMSSNQVGIFTIEGSSGTMMIPGASAQVPLDDLLQAQFDNHMFMNLFATPDSAAGSGALKLNVNLFLHLVFKKFYRDA